MTSRYFEDLNVNAEVRFCDYKSIPVMCFSIDTETSNAPGIDAWGPSSTACRRWTSSSSGPGRRACPAPTSSASTRK